MFSGGQKLVRVSLGWQEGSTLVALRPASLGQKLSREQRKKGPNGCLVYIGDDISYPVIISGLFHKP